MSTRIGIRRIARLKSTMRSQSSKSGRKILQNLLVQCSIMTSSIGTLFRQYIRAIERRTVSKASCFRTSGPSNLSTPICRESLSDTLGSRSTVHASTSSRRYPMATHWRGTSLTWPSSRLIRVIGPYTLKSLIEPHLWPSL